MEFSRTGVSATEKGKQLVHFLNESYDEMETAAQSRAETYLDIADAREKYGDSVLEPDAVNVSGHRELIGRILERKRGDVPEELEAFEDY